MKKSRVLFTSSYGPNELAWGEDQYDLLAARLARGHGLFQMTSHCHAFALYLLAENITNPSTVLEHPHWEDFDAELDQGYEVVCFQLLSLQMAKIARMMKRVREKLPSAKIVVGGYGVGTLEQPVPGDKNGDAQYVLENADYLCREEGVGFMRRVLEDAPYDREITQYHMPTPAFSVPGVPWHLRLPIILVALGCPNGCDFCNTSAFFHHKKIYVAEPQQVYRFMKAYQKRFKSSDVFTLLFDEDMFQNPEYVRELGRLIRSDKKTWGLRWFTFGSIRAISQFSAEELRECGLGAVWVGVESFLCDRERAAESGYAKRGGKSVKEVFADLHGHGIATVGSLVMGFDFHDQSNLRQDVDQFVDLKPTFYQLSPLTPCPGTALYDRMLEEDRILDNYKWEDFNLWKDDVFKLKNFQPGEIKVHFDYAHDRIRDELGPPVVQGVEMMLDAVKEIGDRAKTDKFKAHQAKQMKMAARGMHIYLETVKDKHPSPKVRERARMLDQRFHQETGWPIPLTGVWSAYVKAKLEKAEKKAEAKPTLSDPSPRWSYYHTFDDRVWVRRGRNAKKPVPYRDGFLIAKLARESIWPF